MIFLQENHLQVKYFGDSLGLFAANSEWSRIPLSCPGIVSFCQAFRTSASCQLETNHNITLSFKELPAACTQERCSTCQRSMHVLCQVMLVCKTHVLKPYLISWLYVYKVRFKELDSCLEFPAKAVPLSQFQIILLRSHSMPKSKQDYKKKQVVSNAFLHFWRVTSPSKLISWWQSLEAPGSPVLQDFAVDPLLPQETQTQEALEDPFRGVRANKPGRPANTMTWCTAKSSPPPVNPCFS